ncbi:MAG: ABC transporter ATP-binding protein, partial [Lachnospiraceae bacterium]|nr:ABC transporter ATP-binding protein [Lachnospiraceae bacterium]
MRNVLRANINIIKEINRLDKTRNLFTAVMNLSDIVDIIIYNALFLPFIYYAVERRFPVHRYLLISGILFFVVLFNAAYSKFYHGYIEQLSNMKIKHAYNKLIFIKAGKYDYVDITRSEYYEKYSMLLNIGAGKLAEGLDMIWWAISVFVLSFFYIAVIESISSTLVFAALLCAFTVYFINLKYVKYEYEYHTETVRTSRKTEYFQRIFLMEKYAADLRTTNVFDALEKDKNRMFHKLKKVIVSAVSRKMLLFSIVKKLLLFFVTTVFVAIYLAWNYLIKGDISLSVSEIVVAQALMLQMSTILSDLAMIYPRLKQNMLYMKDYQDFMNYEPAIQENEDGLRPGEGAGALTLRNVSFGYDSGDMVLKNISMEIKAGEKIAIVGYNGAGKSTLVKVLLRLCRPQEGSVLMDGKPAEDYNLKAYRSRFAAAFQESNLYALTASENVLMD